MSYLLESLNGVRSIDCDGSQVQGMAGDVEFSIECLRDDIFRVWIKNSKKNKKYSKAVIQTEVQGKFEFQEDDTHITLKTSAATLSLQKAQFLITLKNRAGEILVEDEPGLGTGRMGNQVITHKKLQDDERFIGLGEKTGDLNKRGGGYTNWNTDSFAYGNHTDPLYSTIPFYIGLHHNRSYGVFLDNTFRSHFNFGASNHRFSSFMAEGGDMDYYLFAGDVQRIIEGYTWLTGRMELPPKWSLGYQQCRYSYYPEHEVRTVARTFRDKQIPCDVLYHDIHYMQDYKVFTWNNERFPNPKRLINELHNDGFKVAVIVDPGIKLEKGYEAHDDGVKQDVFIKYSDGEYYTGDVWPGTCYFPDFSSEKGRKWWGSKFEELVAQGVDAFWNDMNEIATWGNFLPNSLVFNNDGDPISTHEARNVYGTEMAKATKEGVEQFIGDKRTVVITRAAFAGFQRYGVLWTGDNVSSDESMMLGCRMVTGLGLSGLPFTGNDVGGFAGRTEVDLFARWISIAVFQPFLRAHTFVNTADAEPWSFGERVEEIARNYINLRYRLMPYLYGAFVESAASGLPVARSLAINHAHDERVYDAQYQNQFYLGKDILVAPAESTKQIIKVFLPEGVWVDLHTGKQHQGNQIIYQDCPLERLPVFVRAGAVLPMQSLVQSTSQHHDGRLHLHVYPGSVGAQFELYEDDGLTKSGESSTRAIYFDGEGELHIGAVAGKYKTEFDRLVIYLHGAEVSHFEVGDEKINGEIVDYSYFEPISHFDPFEQQGSHPNFKVTRMETSLPTSRLEISW
ncbi:MAG: DUF4968 domain-containing protein [Cyclobacteriaceae bacterium]